MKVRRGVGASGATGRPSRRGASTKALAVAISAGAIVAGCSSGSDDSAKASSTTSTTAAAVVNAGATIDVTDNRFSPSNTTIKAGEVVTWTNDGERKHVVTHNPTTGEADRLFKSDNFDPGQSFQFTFTAPGVYPYICAIHYDTMKGTITVE